MEKKEEKTLKYFLVVFSIKFEKNSSFTSCILIKNKGIKYLHFGIEKKKKKFKYFNKAKDKRSTKNQFLQFQVNHMI